jgi:hypothetical protein
MRYESQLAADERAVRNAALLAAEAERQRATRDAEIEYSETVRKLRERFDAEMAEAARVRINRTAPAYVAYNAAVCAAERGCCPGD